VDKVESVRQPRIASRQSGMTLIELIMAVNIMVVIFLAMTFLIFFVSRSSAPTKVAVTEANDYMLASSFFAHDVQSSQTVLTTSPGATCAGPVPGPSVLAWLSYSTSVGNSNICRLLVRQHESVSD
jgi:prepilin-type N-terminal cleavage/methylation domain-containing protein